MSSSFTTLLKRDLLLVIRNPGDCAAPVIFFVVATTLFAFAAGTDLRLLEAIGAGVIWVAALLSAMLSLSGIFRDDFEDGSLDQLLSAPASLPALVIAKITVHWISTGLPLIAVCPVLSILMNLPVSSIAVLVMTLVISTPVFSIVGAFGAALVVTQKKAGTLLSLLTLPLCVPVMIFSISAVIAAEAGRDITGHLSLLGAFLIFSLTVAPFAIAGTLRLIAGE